MSAPSQANRPAIVGLLKKGVAHYRAGRLGKAEAAYKRVLERQPGHPDALHLLGVLANANGKRERAEELIRQAIAKAPGFAEFHNSLGQVLMAANRPGAAVDAFHQAIALAPDHPDAHATLGAALRRLGRHDEALAAGQRAVELRPDHAPSRHKLGAALKAVNRRDEARAAFSKAIAMKPGFIQAHCSLGLALNEEGMLDEAVACFRKALSINPKYPPAHVMLGNALQEQGHPVEAVTCYRRALEIDPDNATARNNLEIARGFIGRPAEAAQGLRKAVEGKPDDAVARRKLAVALWELGETDDALAEIDEALAIAPDDAQSHFFKGLIRKSRGEREAARNSFGRAMELDSGMTFARGAEASMVAEDESARALAGKTGAKRVALYMQQRYHYNILRPAFDALRGRHLTLMASEVHQLIEFAPDVVVLADTHAALLRARLPDAVFVWVRHGLISKNTTRYGARTADYACMTSAAGRDWYTGHGIRPRRGWWITGFLQMDPLFRDDPLPLPFELAAGTQCVLYAPTWTAGLSSAAMLGKRAVELIRGERGDVSIIIKPHPVSFHQQRDWLEVWRRLAAAGPRVHLVDDAAADVMPYLKAADVLVSDASSVVFQYLAVDRPIVQINNPERHASPHYDPRGFEWLWRDVGQQIDHVEDLPAAVARALDDPSLGAERRAHYRRELFGALTDGRAAERLADKIDELEP